MQSGRLVAFGLISARAQRSHQRAPLPMAPSCRSWALVGVIYHGPNTSNDANEAIPGLEVIPGPAITSRRHAPLASPSPLLARGAGGGCGAWIKVSPEWRGCSPSLTPPPPRSSNFNEAEARHGCAGDDHRGRPSESSGFNEAEANPGERVQLAVGELYPSEDRGRNGASASCFNVRKGREAPPHLFNPPHRRQRSRSWSL
jgi:hypothetical protein